MNKTEKTALLILPVLILAGYGLHDICVSIRSGVESLNRVSSTSSRPIDSSGNYSE